MFSVQAQNLQSWLQQPLQQFWQSHTQEGQTNGFPQTIGVNDAHAAGGDAFAVSLAHALLCENPQSSAEACGHCQQCLLLKSGNHTDLMQLVPEALQAGFVTEKDKKPSKEIKIDQVRAIESQFYLSAQRGGRKVVIVYPAESLGTVPANALLKTLEEPPPHTYFLIVSAHWSQVLPTIRSRCVCINLPAPSTQEKLEWLTANGVAHAPRWLEVAAGKADKARNMAQDPLWLPLLRTAASLAQGAYCNPIELGQVFAKSELKRSCELLTLWMTDLLSVHFGSKPLFFAPQHQALQALSGQLDAEKAADYLAQLAQLSAIAEHPLNARSQCEALLFSYCNLFRTR